MKDERQYHLDTPAPTTIDVTNSPVSAWVSFIMNKKYYIVM